MTDKLSDEEVQRVLLGLEAVEGHRRLNRLLYFDPAPKQKLFYSSSSQYRERLFRAGNGTGKSESGAFEDAVHLTGLYPDWWEGIRYSHPVKMWVACETGTLTRDVMQSKLCGSFGIPADFGTGFIPRDRFSGSPALSRGVKDAFDTIQVIHTTNGVKDGISTCSFKSYAEQREKFQGENLDFGHCDEEPPMDVYTEFLARLRRSELSRMAVTFTPLHGPTKLIEWFNQNSKDRTIIEMSLDEATWYTDKQKEQMLSGYPKHERDARRYGIPLLGSGAVFAYDQAILSEPKILHVPPDWALLWGIDFGLSDEHPFAAVLLAWDRSTDTIHVLHAIRLKGQQPINHAAAMRFVCADAPVAWPHDGTQRIAGEADAAKTLASIYKKFGLKMLFKHATHKDGGYSTEAGIMEIEQRITTNRFKVAEHLSEWWEEYRSYHRKDGLIVKERDDLMSATRVGVMDIRHARAVPMGGRAFVVVGPNGSPQGGSSNLAAGLDFDLFSA